MSSACVRWGICIALCLSLPAACGDSDETQNGAAGAPSGGNTGKGGSIGKSGDSSAEGGASGSDSVGGTPAAAGAQSEGGQGGSAGGEVIGAWVDCDSGSDDGTGSEQDPFATLAKAASMVQSGETIVVVDGLCDETTQTEFNTANGKVSLPDGVTLRALSPGGVTFHGVDGYRSAGIEFLGSGAISGVHFEQFGIAITASSGMLTVSDVTFNDVYQGHPFELSGTADVVLTPGEVENYIGANQHTFALLEGQSKLSVNGGALIGATSSGISGEALFTALDDAQLIFDLVTIEDCTQNVVSVTGNAAATLDKVSIAGSTRPVVISGNAFVSLTHANISDATTAAVSFQSGNPELEMITTTIDGCAGWALYCAIFSNAYPTIAIDDSTISNNGGGIFSNYGATIDITNSQIIDNDLTGSAGVDLNDTQVNRLKLRGTTISGHQLAGIKAVGVAGSIFDFGRGDSLGGNTFSGNDTSDAGQANMVVSVAADTTVYAAGNTWEPGIQDAAPGNSVDPLPGQYAVDGNVWDAIGAATGQNYLIGGPNAATTTLRLAELACVVTNDCP